MNDFPPFGGGDARKVNFGEARAAVLPVPYEGSVSYGGGTSQGPRAIAAASGQLEMYDEELDWCIDEAGIFTLPPVQTAGLTPEQVMAAVHEAALAPLKEGKLLCTLGGEHSISYGVFTALREAKARPFSILQIDAHADLRQSYQGNIHSHACIMARAHELGIPFVQVGIRSLSATEMQFLRGQGLESNVFWARRIAEAGSSRDWMDGVVSRLTEEVYISVDVDALDPGIMPATGTPEPGGLEWYTLLALLRRVAERRRVVALDLMEFAPVAGLHAPDFLAARLVYKMIGYALHGAKELE
ncbi:MAG: agmatinase [SAR324 cluster bacterium]|nr:agmatinase [SAR324 cluster bacterium]MCZ6629030.1 agmatinase [SAR324 cluster bacterium]